MAKAKGYADPKLEQKLRDRYYRTSESNPEFLKKVED